MNVVRSDFSSVCVCQAVAVVKIVEHFADVRVFGYQLGYFLIVYTGSKYAHVLSRVVLVEVVSTSSSLLKHAFSVLFFLYEEDQMSMRTIFPS